ncbi:hypothetical protein Tco_0889534 [Tanacetum coccineum]
MVGLDIDGYYTARFHELARLVPHMVTPENQRVNRYIWGLAPEIKANVTSSRHTTIQSVVSMANCLTTDGIKDKIFKKENAGNKNRLNDQFKNQGMNDKNKRQRIGRNFATTAPDQGQAQRGIVQGLEIDGNPNQGNNRNQACGRAFALGVAEAPQDPNIVTELEGHTFIIDLIPFGHGSFDVIVGMDWLSKRRAKIVCFEKIVQISLSNGEILEVHGERPEGNLKQLKTIKLDEQKLEDILIVRNFPSVFPEDLPSVPPFSEVEFGIDLIPEAIPIAKSPYHLAPMEMQELLNQLKELQDKGFI